MRSFTLFLLLSGMDVYLGIYGVSGPDSTTSDPCSRAIVGNWSVLATKHVIILIQLEHPHCRLLLSFLFVRIYPPFITGNDVIDMFRASVVEFL